MKKKAKQAKKKLLVIIPPWCNWCNAGVVTVVTLLTSAMALGLIPGFSWSIDDGGSGTSTTTTTVTTTVPVTTTTPVPTGTYKLAASLNGWDPLSPTQPDIRVEIYATSSVANPPVHSGILYAVPPLDYSIMVPSAPTGGWWYSHTHTDFVFGFAVTIQIWADSGNVVMVNALNYVHVSVGGPSFTCNLYQVSDLAFPITSMTFKWVAA